ncbi:hypothetical protein COOONC_21970 [Cooperia oncophora]
MHKELIHIGDEADRGCAPVVSSVKLDVEENHLQEGLLAYRQMSYIIDRDDVVKEVRRWLNDNEMTQSAKVEDELRKARERAERQRDDAQRQRERRVDESSEDRRARHTSDADRHRRLRNPPSLTLGIALRSRFVEPNISVA